MSASCQPTLIIKMFSRLYHPLARERVAECNTVHVNSKHTALALVLLDGIDIISTTRVVAAAREARDDWRDDDWRDDTSADDS